MEDMRAKTDCNSDTKEQEYKVKNYITIYDKSGELIHKFAVEDLSGILVDYKRKTFHAYHINGKVYDIDFYKMIIA